MDSKFWNEVYGSKSEREVSWFQDVPVKSLELIEEFALAPQDPIIDIGGGDSRLVDSLLAKGFSDISILDISSVALEKARARLQEFKGLQLITADVTKFVPTRQYALWHDRATFHFLTKAEDVEAYLRIADQALGENGFLVVSTFSKTGPEKCSGLTVSQYSAGELKSLFLKYFTNVRCLEQTHTTPWGAGQNFVYCGFKKRK